MKCSLKNSIRSDRLVCSTSSFPYFFYCKSTNSRSQGKLILHRRWYKCKFHWNHKSSKERNQWATTNLNQLKQGNSKSLIVWKELYILHFLLINKKNQFTKRLKFILRSDKLIWNYKPIVPNNGIIILSKHWEKSQD